MAGKAIQVHERIYQIQAPFLGDGLVMLYLLRGSKTALVDTGIATSPIADVRPALKELGLSLSDVDYILNTHGHHDHLGGNATFKQEAPDVRIHLHAADKPFAESHEYHRTFMTEFLTQFGLYDQLPPRRAVFVKTLGEGNAGVDRVLEDGDRIDLGAGLELSVVHTPGHTPGSVCYYWEAEKLLLSGDAIQGRGSRTGGWPLYFNAGDYRRSLDRLLGLPIETLCLGHGFHGVAALNTPVKQGPEARALLEDSATISRLIDDAVHAQLRATPAASDHEIARAVVMELADRVPLLLDPTIQIPGSGGPTLAAHIREARRGG